MPYQFTTSKFGSVSFAAGTLGSAAIRARPGGGERPQPAGLDVRLRDRQGVEHELNLTADQVGERRRAAAIGHVAGLDAGLQVQQLAGQMRQSAVAARAEQQVARLVPSPSRSAP